MALDNVTNRGECLLGADIAVGASSMTLATGMGALFPTTNFQLNLCNGDLSNYEVVRVSTRSGDVCQITKAQESTSDLAHTMANSTMVKLAITAKMITDINTALVRSNSKDIYIIVDGEIKVPSGDTDYICPIRIRVLSGMTRTLVGCYFRMNSGTYIYFKLQKNGSDLTTFGSSGIMTVSSSWQVSTPTGISLADGDIIQPIVTAVSGTPKNFNIILATNYNFS
jgi:hypothetical protein